MLGPIVDHLDLGFEVSLSPLQGTDFNFLLLDLILKSQYDGNLVTGILLLLRDLASDVHREILLLSEPFFKDLDLADKSLVRLLNLTCLGKSFHLLLSDNLYIDLSILQSFVIFINLVLNLLQLALACLKLSLDLVCVVLRLICFLL